MSENKDPLSIRRELAATDRVSLVRGQDDPYRSWVQTRLVRSKFGLWTIELRLVDEKHLNELETLHVLVDSSIREELMKVGTPVYWEE